MIFSHDFDHLMDPAETGVKQISFTYQPDFHTVHAIPRITKPAGPGPKGSLQFDSILSSQQWNLTKQSLS